MMEGITVQVDGMGIFDKAREALQDHADKIDPVVDRLAAEADKRTGGTHAAHIDRGADLPGAVAVRERRTVLSPSHADSVERFPELQNTPRSSRGFIVVPLA